MQVTSIKCGMLDSFYDTFQACAESGFAGPDSSPPVEMIEIGPLIKENTVSSKQGDAGKLGYSKYFFFRKILLSSSPM